MRRLEALMVAATATLLCVPTAEARPARDPRKVTVRSTDGRRGVLARTGRPGAARVVRATGCHTWTEAGRTWRRCPGLFDGAVFEVADSVPGGAEEGVVTAPSPALITQGAWYAQRTGYVWIDPAYGAPLSAPLLDGDTTVGTATIRLARAVFDAGDGNAIECSRDAVLTPYDPARSHGDQDGCWYVYVVSSRPRAETPDATYHARLRLFWTVDALSFGSGASAGADDLAALGEIESDSAVLRIRVEEIQSLVVCKATTASGCAHG